MDCLKDVVEGYKSLGLDLEVENIKDQKCYRLKVNSCYELIIPYEMLIEDKQLLVEYVTDFFRKTLYK